MSIYGIGSVGSSDIYSSIFGTSSNSMQTSGFSLGDYAMIKSGAYKKLMKAYYASDKSSKTAQTDEKESATKTSLASAKNAADELKESVSEISSRKLYEAKSIDENGKAEYDMEAVSKAVKNFADDYNSYIKSTKELDSYSLSKTSLNVIKNTDKNSKSLSEIGITVNSDFTLSVDEDKLKSADINKISSLFRGGGSYGSQIEEKASKSSRLANSLSFTASKGLSYNGNGNYSDMGSTSSILNELF